MKKKDLIVIIIFISFITMPNIFYWFLKDRMDNSNYENRTLAQKPQLELKNIKSFSKEYENYFNDHLPFKNEVRKTRSKLFYNLFHISSDSRVMIGKDGWFFFTGDNTISDYTKTEYYSKDEKKTIKNKLNEVNNKLSKKNVDFFLFVLPNKETVYAEKINIKRSKNKYSRVEDLLNYLKKETNVNIIFPKNEIIKGKEKTDTYYKYDTHWNDYGSYIGTMQLMKKIDKEYKIPNIKIDYYKRSGDLGVMNLTTFNSKEPIIKGFYDGIKYSCEDKTEFNYCTSDNPKYDKTILFVGDSFRMGTIQYLAKLYKKSIFIHRNQYNADYIEKYNPDIVVYEFVERYSNNINYVDVLTNNYN